VRVTYLDTQMELVEKLGEPLYIAQLIEQPES
jgi:bacterioferritin